MKIMALVKGSRRRAVMLNALELLCTALFCVAGVQWWRSCIMSDMWDVATTSDPDAQQVTVTRRWWIISSNGGLWIDRHVYRYNWQGEPFERSGTTDRFQHTQGEPTGYPYVCPTYAGFSPGTDFKQKCHWLFSFWGIGAQYSTISWGKRNDWHLTVVIPYWLPMAVLAVYPICREIQRRRERVMRKRRLAGLCPQCGYDLRASKERCPECGTAIPAQQVAKRAPMEKDV